MDEYEHLILLADKYVKKDFSSVIEQYCDFILFYKKKSLIAFELFYFKR